LPSLIFATASLILFAMIFINIFGDYLLAAAAIFIFSSSNDFSFLSSQGLAEMELLFFCLLAFYLAVKKNYFLSGLALGLSFLTKSFAVFWVFPTVFTYSILFDKKELGKKIAKLLSAFVITISPWHLFMFTKFGEVFINRYFVVNTFGRGVAAEANLAPIY